MTNASHTEQDCHAEVDQHNAHKNHVGREKEHDKRVVLARVLQNCSRHLDSSWYRDVSPGTSGAVDKVALQLLQLNGATRRGGRKDKQAERTFTRW